jgi:hypothetical protein
MPSLAEFQRELAATLRQSPGAVEAAGIRIHRNTVMKAQIDALLANYPTLEVLMGRAWLADAARAFAQQYPPRHSVLADYGDGFSTFLSGLESVREYAWLSGVAELDHAWTRSLLAADAPALDVEQLAMLQPERLASMKLQLHASATASVFTHSALSVWRANRPPAIPPMDLSADGRDEAAVVVRRAGAVTVLPLTDAGYVFLQLIVAGSRIADAAEGALHAHADADIAGTWSLLLTHGVFAAIPSHGD